jgi:HD-like signal output (HDOD) protein
MLGLFARLRSVFSGTANTTTSKSEPRRARISSKIDIAASNVVTRPNPFSMLTAQYGFYTTVFGHMEDQKPLSAQQKLDRGIVVKALKSKAQRVKSIPRLPSVIPQLLQRLRDPDADVGDYIKIINKDLSLSASVLKLANSVYFNRTSKRVTSIETAMVKLGEQGLRSVLSAAVMQPVIQRRSYYYSEFGHKLWMHSLHCAVACEMIAADRGQEPFKAYLLGLVHDIGKITLFCELSSQFAKSNNSQEPGFAAFAPVMQAASESLSYSVAQDWELPEEICSALKQQIKLKEGDTIDDYAHILFQANLACELYAIVNFDPTEHDAVAQALKNMKLPTDLFKELDLVSKKIYLSDGG